MRPTSLETFVGQEHLVGPEKLIRTSIEQNVLPSLIFWGPPGSGKTTLATIIAHTLQARFVFFSAVLSGVRQIRAIVAEARQATQDNSSKTVLFVDEIHRFNKSQQDAFLPHVESGLLTLIGATTENPSFEINAPLLSRCQVVQLHPLRSDSISQVIGRALQDKENGLGNLDLIMAPEALDLLARCTDGDCRRALNTLETAASLCQRKKEGKKKGLITTDHIQEALQHRPIHYDKNGEQHYNLISALHKSLRDSDPDGAAYWFCRMVQGGEDPLYIARRMIRFASEDIGIADPQALQIALNGRKAFHLLGSPEGELALLQVVVYLATAPKSNAVYMMEKKIQKDIQRTGFLPVPLHIRNGVTKLMREFEYGKGYKYAHDEKDGIVAQQHLPAELEGATYYEPTNRGYEAVVSDRLRKWKKILQQRAQAHGQTKNNG